MYNHTPQLYQTASLELYAYPSGLIEMKFKSDWDQPDTLDTARENMRMLTHLASLRPSALLLYTPPVHQSREVLEFYQKERPNLLACAMLVESFAARLVGNVYLQVARGRTTEPTKLFLDAKKAKKWLQKYITIL
jgi:hypothetical protein